jgi:hypothetical protein
MKFFPSHGWEVAAMAQHDQDAIAVTWDLNGSLPVTPAEAELVAALMTEMRALSGVVAGTKAPVPDTTVDDIIADDEE